MKLKLKINFYTQYVYFYFYQRCLRSFWQTYFSPLFSIKGQRLTLSTVFLFFFFILFFRSFHFARIYLNSLLPVRSSVWTNSIIDHSFLHEHPAHLSCPLPSCRLLFVSCTISNLWYSCSSSLLSLILLCPVFFKPCMDRKYFLITFFRISVVYTLIFNFLIIILIAWYGFSLCNHEFCFLIYYYFYLFIIN